MVFTDTADVYKSAGENFRTSLANFNQSLQYADLLIGIGSPSAFMVNLTNLWLDTNTKSTATNTKISDGENGSLPTLSPLC